MQKQRFAWKGGAAPTPLSFPLKRHFFSSPGEGGLKDKSAKIQSLIAIAVMHYPKNV
jgi:hypothetical protein